MRVCTKLFICTALILTPAIVLAYWWSYRTHREQLQIFSREKVAALATSVERAIDLAMIQNDREQIQGVMAAAERVADIAIVALLNPEGVVKAASPAELVDHRLPPEKLQAYLARVPHVFPDRTAAGEIVEAVIRPLVNRQPCQGCHGREEANNGYLYVAVSPRRINTLLATDLQHISIAAAVTLVAGLVALALLSDRLIARPIAALVGAMQAVEDGRTGARAPVLGGKEFGRLAGQFNAMVARAEAAQQEVERAHRAELDRAAHFATVGELAASLAHEVKNPLAGIQGAVQVLRDQTAPGDPQREVFEAILEQAERLGRTVKGLLDFARPVPVRFAPATLNDVVERVAGLIARDPTAARATLVKDLAMDLPAVHLDEAQIGQVLLNILLNAFQVVPGGGQVTVRTRRDGPGHVSLEVVDTGPGIPRDVLPQIFKPFFTTKHQGSGLGLAICERIVRDHGGTIEACNGQKSGACFCVRLPVRGPGAAPDAGGTPPSSQTGSMDSAAGRRRGRDGGSS